MHQQQIPGRKKRVVIPFYHADSNNLKSLAQQFDLDMFFWNDIRLSHLTSLQKEKEHCTNDHGSPVATFEMGIVYEIAVGRCQTYIGQTGRCFNEKANEHKCNVNHRTILSLLSMHLQ